ncbi:hypothetical protein [Streptomyces sp. WMMB 322]|uniref:hypothetical protein n=1 Tax=Streptomyces sp. WMMB 322 TaxID=1286821 RepID=UPI0006E1353E|nr:hypothetical protein [Streptomyces sp. WMMB 322]SCK14025.1 hypothetical protein H180DRAFT_00877 [Streptomyces sp. WMMB 322]
MTAGADLRLLRAAVFTAVCVALSAAGHSLTGGHSMPLWSLGLGFAVVFAVAAPLAGRERSLPGIAALLAAGQVALHTLFACERPAAGTARAAAAATPPAHGAHAGGQGAELRSLAARLLCDEQSAGRMSVSRARQIVSEAGLDSGRLGSRAAQAGHPGSSGHGHAGHEAAGGGAAWADTPLECLRTAAHAVMGLTDGPMLLGHVLAALALGWFLHRGEAALWRIVRLSARTCRTAVRHVRASLGAALAHVRALRGGAVPKMPAGAGLLDAHRHGTARSVLLQHSVNRRGPPRGTQQENLALAA